MLSKRSIAITMSPAVRLAFSVSLSNVLSDLVPAMLHWNHEHASPESCVSLQSNAEWHSKRVFKKPLLGDFLIIMYR